MENKVYVVTATSVYGPDITTNVYVRSTLEQAKEKFEELIQKCKKSTDREITIDRNTPYKCEIQEDFDSDWTEVFQIFEREVY